MENNGEVMRAIGRIEGKLNILPDIRTDIDNIQKHLSNINGTIGKLERQPDICEQRFSKIENNGGYFLAKKIFKIFKK